MGLFGFRKDEKKDEEELAEIQAEIESEETDVSEAHELNDGRRFFFVAEEVVPVKAGAVVRGTVHGRIDLDDEVFIYQSGKKLIKTAVRGMNAVIESFMMKIQTATDMQVNLLVPVNPADIEKFAVITSVKPQFEVREGDGIENPIAAAFLYEKKLFADAEFFDRLCFTLVHGRFVTPARVSQEPLDNADAPVNFGKDTSFGFCMLPDPKNKNMRLLPVFTDWNELDKWEGMANDESVKRVVLTFAEITAITSQPRFSGFVINPYSGNQTIISREIIRAITESDGYKQEFLKSGSSEDDSDETASSIT